MAPKNPKIGNPCDLVEIGLHSVSTCLELVKACWSVSIYNEGW